MSRSLSIALAQLNLLVGDIEGNTERMLQTVQEQQKAGADLVMFTELALSGYPPEDLLYRNDFYQRCDAQLHRLQQASAEVAILVGHPWREGDKLYNALSLFSEGQLLTRYFKQQLPNYGVFDEKRYFEAGKETCVVELKGYQLGLLICEDLWFPEPVDAAKAAGAEMILSINASPYNREKPYIRKTLMAGHCQRTHLPLVYLNQIGGQDELIFDGCSKVFDAAGNMTHRLTAFAEQVTLLELNELEVVPMTAPAAELPQLAQVYEALVLAVRDYVTKNGFKGAVLGLSGGIDSALTLAIAVDALGKDKVQALMMPFRYTADISIADAKEEAEILGIEFDIVSIEPMFDAFMGQLTPMFAGTERDTTEENLQARCRGVVLMALSNKRRSIVLTTGNKSEMAVGYATLYGDMAGGFDVLKDVPKTLVFKLSEYRNTVSYVIPQRVIDRPPSAELAPDQLDQDSLPPYDILDAILEGYVERDKSVADLVAEGFDEAIVRKVIRLVDINEYKRRQAAVGPRITARNFGKDRRYPITSGFGRKNW
ncbi:NAD+ synthase [Serratia proteamaculans]|jgi:NAD+ synthase (glutamine-hydrolysing)|uniref:NAD+ synthase n=1 Tax=Serratia proteamaculans TaxID=28151 RepID=UPI0021778622|nr:NAD+ synthase [Serratia proteamaculans]CAI1216895.1 Glutamine-dependent NAD(+) synthetase [Serratia proteamaculans]CAI1809865.1 Glutamine-dependent NAD(+) synthetase [Serratia proteamaculans]CAI1937779.1 Glutamine-dependent NAD(+) synthetase [Serratia proteamaculans]CAI1938689.1 Glutamine-dependent NAD(+) synthetase [Serratia proteamaculans]CAI2508361.1 Glutamine-dependent NAD(+) synthetase [Serratia proteamaculans]